jgi:nucleotide-binding universal stress UspA family protein
MTSPVAHRAFADPAKRVAPFGRVLVGYDGSERCEDALALARRLVDPGSGTIGVRDRLDGRHRISPADADAVVVASASHVPTGRIRVHHGLLRLLQRTGVPVAVAPAGHRVTGRFHHVGVAVDNSPEAATALACAYALAARDGSAVTLVRVLPRVADDIVTERERLHERLTAQEQLDRAADLAPAGVNPEARLLHGDPGTVLGKAFDACADLVVCGTHGYGLLERALVGSVSKAVLEAATQPVVVVPTHRTAP